MNKQVFHIGTITLFSILVLGLCPESSFAASSSWTQMTSWFQTKAPSKPYWINGNNELPSALIGTTYAHKIDLTQWIRDDSSGSPQFSFELEAPHPAWLQISANGLYLEGNQMPVSQQGQNQVEVKIIVKNLKTKQVSNLQTFTLLLAEPVKEPVVVSPLFTQAESEPSLPHTFEKPVEKPIPQWMDKQIKLPMANNGASYPYRIDLTQYLTKTPDSNNHPITFVIDKSPSWLQLNNDGKTLEGNSHNIIETGNQALIYIHAIDPATKNTSDNAIFTIDINQADVKPKWSISEFPAVAIAESDYADINLNEYVSDSLPDDHFFFSLTPGKANSPWVQLADNGILKLLPQKISLEDTNTTQIIYLTATSSKTKQSTPTEITIKIVSNEKLPPPQWNKNFKLDVGVIGRPYSVNLARWVNLSDLAEQDQLVFQLVNSPVDWLEIADNGYFLVSKGIPESAAEKTYNVTLRVTSKMSNKSNDFNGQIFINEAPKPLQWLNLPKITLNHDYNINLTDYIVSNVKDDRFSFRVNYSTKPGWLSFQNSKFLVGKVTDPKTLLEEQSIDISAISEITGQVNSVHLIIPFVPLPQYAPHWQKAFLPNFVVGDTYKSDDLLTKLNKGLANDPISIQYVSGPSWLQYNENCHCLISPSAVDSNLIGKSFTIQLEASSKISGEQVKYSQEIKVYSGIPRWKKTTMPDVKIAQKEPWEISLNSMVDLDPTNDKFNFVVDPFQSPKWIRVVKKNDQSYLAINTTDISANEVDTVQTIRVISGSQSTGKTGTQSFIINIKANRDLPGPTLKEFSLPEATVRVTQTTDIMKFIRIIPNDSVRILLAPNSPKWLQIKNNQLISSPPLSAMGDPFPINLLIYSQAADKYSSLQTQLNVQLMVVSGDNMESHTFYDNHTSVVVRGLEKNREYRLSKVKVDHFDYGPYYSPTAIKTVEDWENSPSFAINDDKIVKTGDDGTVSLVYYNLPNSPAPQIDFLILK